MSKLEVDNPIKPALTSRETTLMVSVLEVEVKLNLTIQQRVDGQSEQQHTEQQQQEPQ